MKLSEALINRKQLVASIAALQNRFLQNAVVEEGTEPEEKPLPIFEKLSAHHRQLEQLNANINHTNNITAVGKGTITQAIAYRDSLKAQIAGFTAIIQFLRGRNGNRYDKDAPKKILVEGVDLRELGQIQDQLAKELRELDLAIQTVNWSSDLIVLD